MSKRYLKRFHFWVSTQKDLKQGSELILALLTSVHSMPKLEATPVSIDGEADKQNEAYPSHGIKRREILIPVSAWVNLEDVMLGEISQSQKDICYLIPLRQTHRDRK